MTTMRGRIPPQTVTAAGDGSFLRLLAPVFHNETPTRRRVKPTEQILFRGGGKERHGTAQKRTTMRGSSGIPSAHSSNDVLLTALLGRSVVAAVEVEEGW